MLDANYAKSLFLFYEILNAMKNNKEETIVLQKE